ncbi:hypothetical protein A9797_18040 [Edwardsiella piscicida]|uniref:hypothetical protein n=1 Tax=Edwardsiella piscicida TaxID=1263550 RepID=UPI001CEC0C48|nr:hypothetical protein [Edwardsiella piscicida]UBU80040.1 hypothetical protein A9797_18040 [Edwardsiella piscicida]
MPPGGLLQAQFRLSGLPHPLRLRLIWQRQGGACCSTRWISPARWSICPGSSSRGR